MRSVLLAGLVLPGVLSQLSQHPLLAWLAPRVRSSSRCEGMCENLLMCGLTGGKVVEQGECEGIITVCCLHDTTTTELSRVPRQLSVSRPPPRLPRQARLATLSSPESPRRFNYHQNKIVRKLSKSKYRGTRLKHGKKVRAELDNLVGGGAAGGGAVGGGAAGGGAAGGGAAGGGAVGGEWRGCGLSRQVAESRILGGSDAGYAQFPWTALIQIYSRDHGLDKMCAGSLVQDRYILTAGHCVHYCQQGLLPNCTSPIPVKELTFKVVLGQYDLLNPSKDENIQRYYATEVFLHPDFTNIFRMRDDGFLESEPTHDVALLLLDRAVKPRANIGSVCLPDSSLYLEEGTKGTVTGWGRLGVEEGSPHSSTLQAVTVPVLSRAECSEQPGASVPSQDQLCAGHSNSQQSACPGDSGGPLMIRSQDLKWRIIGIVSTGPAQCGLTPVIYHNVLSSIDWIRETMRTSTDTVR